MNKLRSLGTRLFDAQMWFFGRDIMHPRSNLLIDYGFRRYKCPPDMKRGSMYLLDLGNGNEIAMWGFGIVHRCEDCQPLFLRRYDFQPCLLRCSRFEWPIWRAETLETPGTTDALLSDSARIVNLIDWICGYENWAVAAVGRNWRNECIREWGKAAGSYRAFARGWQRLRRGIEQL